MATAVEEKEAIWVEGVGDVDDKKQREEDGEPVSLEG